MLCQIMKQFKSQNMQCVGLDLSVSTIYHCFFLATKMFFHCPQGDLVAVGVLSGNRNFEGRVHPNTRANYLASPPLVIAYAIAGTVRIDFEAEPLGKRHFLFHFIFHLTAQV